MEESSEKLYPFVEVEAAEWPTHYGWCYSEWEVSDEDGEPSSEYHIEHTTYDVSEGYDSHGVEPMFFRRSKITPTKAGVWLITHSHDEWGDELYCDWVWYVSVRKDGAFFWKLQKKQKNRNGFVIRRLYTDKGVVTEYEEEEEEEEE